VVAEHGVGDEDRIAATVRLDLDDLGGEVCLVDFGQGPATLVPAGQKIPRVFMMKGLVSVTIAPETESICERVFSKRLVPIEGVTASLPLFSEHDSRTLFESSSRLLTAGHRQAHRANLCFFPSSPSVLWDLVLGVWKPFAWFEPTTVVSARRK
jgi:hypothetical protein